MKYHSYWRLLYFRIIRQSIPLCIYQFTLSHIIKRTDGNWSLLVVIKSCDNSLIIFRTKFPVVNLQT